ncbi:beta-lactamase family protein [Crossiella sp. SN42]|uniref:serine hydrolase domain-containing protein n=1 Tax=Crossiella sp. SN42 TaxID=2944808 RepID=UPI00207D007C|nr:serine hydrolase domain-containing protein [Crossiella sp. SN42]MCO1575758.1 beta-lactamase family protein [Crossiella sp. SN42]
MANKITSSTRLALAVALLAGAATPAMAADSPAATGPDRPELRKAIQEVVAYGFAGVQLRVQDQHGTWTGSAGVRKLGETAKPRTDGRFRIGSNTKTFVATLVLQLVDAGTIELDRPAADYLPELGLDRQITVRMLLQQTTGLLDFTGDFDADGKYVQGIPWQGKEWVANRFRTYPPGELARLALSQRLKFVPGTAWSYSNTNYLLAALLVEKVTGHSYGEEMRARLLAPLGLTGTEVPGARIGISGPHAHGYYRYQDAEQRWQVVDVTRQNPSWIHAGGEMISTTEDLRKFFTALQRGEILSAPLLAEMRKPHPESPGYGLGLFVQDGKSGSPFPPPRCAVTVFTHNGGVKGYGALMYSTPDGKTVLTASVTSGNAAIDEAQAFRKAQQRLVDEVFCGGRTG